MTEDSNVDRWIVDPGSVVPGQLHTSLVAEHLIKINYSVFTGDSWTNADEDFFFYRMKYIQ